MVQQWCREELETADFGDQRLNERVVQVLESLADRPTASIPAALGGRSELEAAYRFFDNDKVTLEKVLQAHFHVTTKRCTEQRIVLCAQDTSELDFSRPQQQVSGAGPLASPNRRGALLHANLAFAEDGTPLGAIGAKIWAREESDSEQPKLSKAAKEKKRRATPIEEKESIRWIEGIRAVQKLARDCPDTLCVSLSDSEGDMYDLLAEPRTTSNFHWIVRACHDRTVLDFQGNPVGAIRDSLLELPVLFTNDITIQGRKQKIACETNPRRTSRVSRQATVEVRAGSVTVKAPSLCKHAIPAVTINVVLVREPHPPEGEHPIEWILLTTLPISTMEQVRSVIRY